jgi:hypothetical protein
VEYIFSQGLTEGEMEYCRGRRQLETGAPCLSCHGVVDALLYAIDSLRLGQHTELLYFFHLSFLPQRTEQGLAADWPLLTLVSPLLTLVPLSARC